MISLFFFFFFFFFLHFYIVVYLSSSDEFCPIHSIHLLIFRFGGVIFSDNRSVSRARLSRVVIGTLFNLLFCIMNILSYACIMKCLNVFVPLPCYNWNRHPWLLLILTDVALDWPLIVI